MQYRALGHSGINASVVGLGAWVMGGGTWWGKDPDDRESMVAVASALHIARRYTRCVPQRKSAMASVTGLVTPRSVSWPLAETGTSPSKLNSAAA